jgi:Zn-dependent protease with chaperone function
MIGIALGILALILVGPGSIWVGQWHFLYRCPRPAVALWQAGSIAALASIVGAGVALSHGLLQTDLTVAGIIVYSVILGFTVIVVIRLIWSLITVVRDSGVRRARHRHAVDVLAQMDEVPQTPGLRVIAESMPVAYCLPAVRKARVVLSLGALQKLDGDEVAAVLAHEAAHVRARHDLVLDTFEALHRAFPIAARSEVPLQEARLLVEMLADDAARRRTGAVPLARALVAMASSPVPRGAIGASYKTAVRVARLAETIRPHRLLSAGVYLLSAGLVATPVVIFFAPVLITWLHLPWHGIQLGWY